MTSFITPDVGVQVAPVFRLWCFWIEDLLGCGQSSLSRRQREATQLRLHLFKVLIDERHHFEVVGDDAHLVELAMLLDEMTVGGIILFAFDCFCFVAVFDAKLSLLS